MTTQMSIVFFDGTCQLCNGWVDFLISHDRHRTLLFASLQGETAKKLLSPERIQSLSSLVFYTPEEQFQKSQAVLEILSRLPAPWKFLRHLAWIPTLLRDLLYDFIAQNRFRIRSQRQSCRIPNSEEKTYFLA